MLSDYSNSNSKNLGSQGQDSTQRHRKAKVTFVLPTRHKGHQPTEKQTESEMSFKKEKRPSKPLKISKGKGKKR